MIFYKGLLDEPAKILEELLAQPLYWERGRQETGYLKAALAPRWSAPGPATILPKYIQSLVSILYHCIGAEIKAFDSYLLHYPTGSYIPKHTDDVVFNARHIRANAILKQSSIGGQLYLGTPGVLIELREGDVLVFEPNSIEHSVGVTEDDRYVLTVGTII